MKKLFFIISIITGVLITSCRNDLKEFYSGKNAVYFSNFTETADSVTYSFVGKGKDLDTIYLDVKLLGYQLEMSKNMKITVIPEKTTAIEGDYYEALEPYYEFPVDTFVYQLPIILKKHPDLDQGAYVLAVKINESEDLEVAFQHKAEARIIFSNVIMKPAIWDALLAPLFGVYSKTKHAICMEIMGRPFPETTTEFNVEKKVWTNYGWLCNAYFADNIVMDNDLVPPARILPWF